MRMPSRIRYIADALRWRWLNVVDRLLFSLPVERAMARRFAVPDAGAVGEMQRMYVDVSVIHENDAGTGIQRVVRSLREHLPVAVGQSVDLEFAIVSNERGGYATTAGAPILGSPGSLFFGLDFATDSVFRFRRDLRKFKLAGGQLWFLVHDVLPLSHPDWFTHASRLKYRRWLRVCAALADGILCVSPVVAGQVANLIKSRYGRIDLPHIATIDPGSDIMPANLELACSALPETAGLNFSKFRHAALVVGTLEPRKGHADVLAAFELLWREGHAIPLILVGRAGWRTDALQSRIRGHKQHGRLLFWLEDVDDQSLHAAYRYCRLVIVPSLAEGYGLPLDEALAHGAPVLARNIPVFRRHNGAPVRYFGAQADAVSIASSIFASHAMANGPREIPPLRQWHDTAWQVARELGCTERTGSLATG